MKWLMPGMGVKRWLLLLIVGLALLGMGMALLPEIIGLSTWMETMQRLRPVFVSPALQLVLLTIAAGIVLYTAVLGLNRSLLSAFRRTEPGEVVDVVYRHRQRQRGPRIVAIGGGHGLNTLLRGLKEYTDNITAIVTVADDGGSSGQLRRDLGILPPGDFRNCIAALSDAEGLMTQLLQYRFGDDSNLGGHSFGNLYLTAMTAVTGSFESALNESGRVLAVRGRVIPSTLTLVTLCADVVLPAGKQVAGAARPAAAVEGKWHRVCGESRIPNSGGRIHRVYLDPEDVPAYPGAIRAILDADLIVVGPGSLYTSVLTNLLVRDLARAIASAPAPKIYVCNVATQAGETEGYDITDHMRAIHDHIGPNVIQVVLANRTFPSAQPSTTGVDWVRLPRPGPLPYRLVTRDLVDSDYPWRHDPEKLAKAIMEFVNT